MLNMIKAELYKYAHRPYMYVMVGVTSFMVLSMMLLLNTGDGYGKVFFINNAMHYSFEVILILIPIFAVPLSEEYKYGSMKNLSTSNISRSKIFIGKFITQCILGFIAYSITFIVFIASMSLIQNGVGYSTEMYRNFLLRLVAMIPILFGALAIVNFFLVIIQHDSFAQIVYIFLIIGTEDSIKYLSKTVWSKVVYIKTWLIMCQAKWINGNNIPREAIVHGVLVGVITMMVFTLAGTVIFSKKEMK